MSIPDPCCLSYFVLKEPFPLKMSMFMRDNFSKKYLFIIF